MGVDWTTIKGAIHTWAMDGSGLADAKIVFAPAKVRPAAPYIVISTMALGRVGQDYTRHSYNAGNDNLDITHEGMRRFVLQFQAFGTEGIGTGSPTDLLDNIVLERESETRHEALNTAKIGVQRFEPILPLGAVIGSSTWEPRAVMLVHTLVPSEVTTTAEYIEFAEIQGVESYWGPEFTVG